MKDKSINLQRTQSLLMELVPEALGQLDDTLINGLTITEVDCRNGKYDAKVYFDGSDFSKEELKLVRASLRKANSRLKSYILNATGWYKCPNFEFIVDDMLEKRNKLEDLFAQIAKTKKEENE
ncbi:MAG: 30S ribosome-binding factor RbfA [Campylobacterales bacterium]|nr:30S ribosome-binding factor RbfA [Campylobacterales bacterium]